MCVVAAKHFKDTGWILVKNRDRNYPTEVKLVQSQRAGIERLFLRDTTTGYSEGLNEYGVAIVSASVMVKKDEKEGGSRASDSQNWTSPDGQRIRRALYQKTVDAAVKSLLQSQIPGNTLITDGKVCYLIEAAYTNYEKPDQKYHSIVKKIQPKDICVRTNHGIELPWTGYKMSDPDQKPDRLSSESRLKIATAEVKKAKDPQSLLNALGVAPKSNPQMNPIRINKGKGVMRTTGQIMLNPKDKVFTYRPTMSEVELKNYNKINDRESKTYFEIISNRELISFGTFKEDAKRIPRKPGQKAGSDKHSDLYTDENPKGTIHGLGFTDAAKAKSSINKIEGSGKTHAHKMQAAIAMSQRAKVAARRAKDPEKKSDLGQAHKVYQAWINKNKKEESMMERMNKAIREKTEKWEDGFKRRVVKTTDPEHKKDGYNWRIKGKERDEISIKLYKEKPDFEEFKKQMKRVAGHEFG